MIHDGFLRSGKVIQSHLFSTRESCKPDVASKQTTAYFQELLMDTAMNHKNQPNMAVAPLAFRVGKTWNMFTSSSFLEQTWSSIAIHRPSMLWGEISPCHENGAWDGIGRILQTSMILSWNDHLWYSNIVILQCLALLRHWAIFSTRSTSRGNSCKCCHSWLHVQSLETQKHLVKSSQNSFHQPKNRDVHEFLPQNWLSLHQKKNWLPYLPQPLGCHVIPACNKVINSPEGRSALERRTSRASKSLRWQVALNALHGEMFRNEGCFLNPGPSFIAPRCF